jgi:hypothetical protein
LISQTNHLNLGHQKHMYRTTEVVYCAAHEVAPRRVRVDSLL